LATAQSTCDAVIMRKRSKIHVALAIGLLTAASGCMAPWTPVRSAASSISVMQDASSTADAEDLATRSPVESLEPNVDSTPQTTEEAMAAVMDELQQIGAIDHAAQQKLMANLHEAKPEQWPRIVEQFQSALAFREQLAAKESQSSKSAMMQVSSNSVYAPKGHIQKEGAAMPSKAVSSEQAAIGPADPMPPPLETPKPTALAATNTPASEPQVVEQASHTDSMAPTETSEKHKRRSFRWNSRPNSRRRASKTCSSTCDCDSCGC